MILLTAFGTDAVTEIGIGVIVDIQLDFLPVAGVVTNFLTPCANREQSLQPFDMRERTLKLGDETFSFLIYTVLVQSHLDGNSDKVHLERLEDIAERLRDLRKIGRASCRERV